MKIIRTYPDLCKTCGSKGFITDPFPTTTNITKVCPVCNGGGVITITEEYDALVEVSVDSIERFNKLPWAKPPLLKVDDSALEKVIKRKIEEQLFQPISWKQQRQSLGLSLRQVSEKTGVSISTISRIERNLGKYYITTYDKLITFYNKWKEKNLQ